jgi:predicted outer membrane repeat protein
MRPASLLKLLTAPLACTLLLACGGGGAGTGDDDVDPGTDGGLPDGGTDGTVTPPIDAGIDAPQPQNLTVCATGGTYATIGDAAAAAVPGSTLHLCPGTYHELLVIDKALTIAGDGGAAATILDGSSFGTPLTVRNVGAATGGVTVQGVTVAHGMSATEGGGVRCESSKLTILDSVLDGNVAVEGGGLYAVTCQLDVQRTRFTGNSAAATNEHAGGGAKLVGSTGTVADSAFLGNRASLGAGIYTGDLRLPPDVVVASEVALLRNDISMNTGHRGGGVYHASAADLIGNRIADNTVDWTGGGVFVVDHAPLISMNVISGNHSPNDGGGIYLEHAPATFQANEVRANVSDDDGGGVRVFESAAMLIGNLIEDNRAGDGGGGIRVSHVPATLVDNIVRNNDAGGTGGGMDLDNDASTVRGGEITGNHAGGSGGGIFAWLGPWNGHRFENILIANNRAWQGGGMYMVDNFKPVVLKGLRFTGNRASKGGGLMVSSTDFTLTGTLFADNIATDRGGAIFAGASPVWHGTGPVDGACPCPPVAPVGNLGFTVMARNQSPHGAGVWSAFPSLQISGSIFHAQDGTAVEAQEAPPPDPTAPPLPPPPVPTVRYSSIFPAMFANMPDPTGSEGNLAVDCGFVDAVGGDFHLVAGSACIDAAAPDVLDTDGTRADMGMFGGTP